MDEHKNRLHNLRKRMDEYGIEIAIIQFFVDIYYFSGSNQLSTLIVPLEGDPVLFVQVGIEAAKDETWIKDIRRLKGLISLKEYFKEKKIKARNIGINEDTVTGTLYKKYKESFPGANFINISPLMQEIRAIKSESEIGWIEKAAEVSLRGHQRVEEVVKEGITELDLSAAVEYCVRKAAHSGCSISRKNGFFPPAGPIGPSGPNLGVISGFGAITISGTGLSSAQPGGASLRKMNSGDMTMADININIGGYHSDETRMYVIGSPDDQQKRAFETIFTAYQVALDTIRPGVKGKHVYEAARKAVEKAGYLDYFAGFSRYPQYNYLGHGVGLESNEHPLISPRDETILEPNMVIAIEPKLIAPHWGGSLEDTILITQNGYRILTNTKRELIVV
jgi:Xaa-Pro aminopeptidase